MSAVPDSPLRRLSIALFGIVGIGLLATGVVYLLTDQFMPYHGEALQADWHDLDINLQSLILGLIKGLGSGAFVAGLAILAMTCLSAKRGSAPYLLVLPVVAVTYTTLLCYATYTVATRTPGNPPLIPTIALVLASIVASTAMMVTNESDSS